MKNFADLDINNKVIGVKSVGDNYINPGNSIEIQNYDIKLMGTNYQNGIFQGYYITLRADKSTIIADGADKTVITARIYNYDDTSATDFATGIIFDVNGTQQIIVPTNGEAAIEFKSSVAGSYIIKTANDVMSNSEVTIIAS